MPFSTYAELQTEIASLLNRDDLVADIPGFIALAEAEISRDIREHWRLEKRATASVYSRYTALPTDWQGAVRVSYEIGNGVQDVDLVSTAEMANKRRQNNTSGAPLYYCITGGELELYPTPDDTYVVDLLYRAPIPALSDLAPTNWLLTLAPDLYLYGAAKHSAPWLRDDPRLQVWQAFYGTAVDGITGQSREVRHSGTGLKMKIRSN